ncbi:hypothetical protein ACSNN7_05150 [Micromonospora sp. URMC 105]|uniref:hypothetical protein n=1 Tax=Micromonospora sp. URMC 105 TaxID=3423413 RepID=UPI003F1A7F8A
MSYRDWERGEGSPRERQPVAPWDDLGEAAPADPYSSATDRYRTPSRRRAIERGQREPVDAYLPRWAVESGIAHADGRGRHAAPDDDEDDDRPVSGGGRRSAERRSERSWGEVRAIGAAPESDHTREWTFDRPQEQGYVGSRRADDDPVSGAAPTPRPRRSASRRPQVVWSGVEESDDESGAAAREVERPTRRRRRASAEGWSRPAADSWSRREPVAEPEPEYRPAVDPWDASGVHAWQRPEPEPRWDGAGGAAGWDQGDSTGQWDRFTDTGQWDRGDLARRGRYDEPSRWEDRTDVGRWDRTEPPRSTEPVTGEGWSWPEQPDGFWSGTRLAGDDPRWMDPPPSAPRSPAVAYTAPRPRPAPRRRAEPAAGVPASSWRDRIESVGGGGWNRRLEDDLLDPDPGGPLRPLLYTAACYLVPTALVFAWLLTLDGQAPAGCVTDISGGGCDSARAHAFASLVAGGPRFGLALVSSLVVAVLLRRVGTTWRSATVALAAAVVGGGLSTVMISAVTGQPIG